MHLIGKPLFARALLWLAIVTAATAAHAQFLKPTDNLVIDGIPPISEELVTKVQAYTDFKPSSIVAWHPTQHAMLIRMRLNNTLQLHLVASPGARPDPLTDFPDAVNGASYQPGKGEYILFQKASGGDEVFQIFRLDLATRKVTAISDPDVRASAPAWSRKGDRIVYTTTTIDRNTASRVPMTRLILADPLKPETAKTIATFQGGGWRGFRFSPDDKRLVYAEYVSANESHLWTMHIASGIKKRVVLAKKDDAVPVSYNQARFSRDGRKLFATSDRNSEYRHLVMIDLGKGTETVLTPKLQHDVTDFSISTSARRIAFITNENGSSVLRFLDLNTFAELPRPALLPGEISGLHWKSGGDDDRADAAVTAGEPKTGKDQTGHEVAFNVSSARSPGDVYSWSVAATRIIRWTHSGSPALNPLDFAEPKLLRWKSFDGLMISGFIYQPDATKFPGKRPVVINIHGGPESQARPGFIGRNNYMINESGIAMLYPNVRGSSGFGKTFLALDNGMKREDSVKDIGALFDWIKEQPDLDANKVLVMGGSYGGYMALAVATHYPDRIASAIDIVGISNWVTFLSNTESYRRDLRRVEYGDERIPEMRRFLESISPLNHAQKIRKPLFVVHGRNDPRVPYTEAEQIVAQLKKQGTPVWFLTANDEGHGFAKKSNADFLFYAQIKFMEQTLLK
ncbi:MAG: S9 family peptidase [Burkholderiales bacterium]|nr:S9 family peptidase [Burkholderiales bacterium]